MTGALNKLLLLPHLTRARLQLCPDRTPHTKKGPPKFSGPAHHNGWLYLVRPRSFTVSQSHRRCRHHDRR